MPNGEPICEKCPLQEICLARKENLTDSIPVRNAKVERRKEQKTVFLLECEGKVAIRKRESTGLLANLYEFPNVDGKLSIKEIQNVLAKWNLVGKKPQKAGTHHHIFSHVEWDMVGFKVSVEKVNDAFFWVDKQEILEKYAIPGAFVPFREKVNAKHKGEK